MGPNKDVSTADKNQSENTVPALALLHTDAGIYGKYAIEAVENYESGGHRARITLTGHGFLSGDVVTFSGWPTQTDLNGSFDILVEDNNTFTFLLPSGDDAITDDIATVKVGKLEESVIANFPTHIHVQRIEQVTPGGSNFIGASVEVRSHPASDWFQIVTLVTQESIVEFPVPYNFVRVVAVDAICEVFAQFEGRKSRYR